MESGLSDHPIQKFAVRVKEIGDRLGLITGPSDNQADMLVNILAEALRAYMNLWKAASEKDIQYAAFALRNLLELLVWGTYCSVSKENASRLRQDSARDAVGMVRAIEAMPTNIETIAAFEQSISTARVALQSFAAVAGIESTDDDFCPVSKAALSLDPQLATLFRSLNKFLSKFVHPTAMSIKVLWPPDVSAELTKVLLVIGTVIFEAVVQMSDAAVLEVS